MHNKLSAVVLFVCALSIGCSQPAKTPTQAVQKPKAGVTGKDGACCLSQAPSRFAIIKNDSISRKAVNQ